MAAATPSLITGTATLAIRNLTGSGANTHPRRLGQASKADIVSVTERTADHGNAAAEAAAAARPVRQAAAADHSAGDDRRNPDLRAGDRQFPHEPAQRPAGGGQHRGPGAGCGALGHGAGFAGAADPAPASARARSPSRWASSAGCWPAPTCRRRSTMMSTCATMTVWSAIVDSFEIMLETGNQAIRVVGPAPGGAQFIEVVIDEAPLRAGDVPVFPQSAAGLAGDRDADRGAGLSRAALSVRAADAAADRESGRLPRESRKLGAHHRAEPARRRDRRRRARIVRHAARPGVDAASEEPAGGARPRGLQDQPRSAQSAGVVATAVGPARQRARSAGAALCAETDALAGARHRVLPVDAVLWPRPGGRPRPPHDPDRAGGGRSPRIRRPCRGCVDRLDQPRSSAG